MLLTAIALLGHTLAPATHWRERFLRLPPFAQGLVYGLGAFVAFLLSPASEGFIYFQF